MSDNKYNGWTNYETWVVELWIDNDQGTQGYWLERAAERITENTETDYDTDKVSTDEAAAVRGLSDDLEQHYEDLEEMGVKVEGLYSDLLTSALGRVEWREIAEALIQGAKEQLE